MQFENDANASTASQTADPQDWRARVIHGSELGPSSLPGWLDGSYQTLREHVLDDAYPCFFGTQAERRGEMFYAFVEGRDIAMLPQTMAKFAELASQPEFEKNNVAIFFEPDPQPLTHDEYREHFWQVLQHLHDHDPHPAADHQHAPSDPQWEFSFGGVEMFVVCACPSFQQRVSRNLGPGMVLLFQPRSVFVDKITNRVIGKQARQQVRKRLDVWDRIAAHPDLGFYGEPGNLEWKQYFLPDDNAPAAGLCPFLSRGQRRQAKPAAPAPVADPDADPAGDGATPPTILHALAHHVATRPDATAITFLADGESIEQTLTYAELDARARNLAASLAAQADAGERALLLLPSGLDYVVSFFACLYAGIIAVPAYPAETSNAQHFARLKAMLADCGPRLLLTDEKHASLLGNFGPDALAGDAKVVVPSRCAEPQADAASPRFDAAEPQTIAFLQYTSGSTALPKGVIVTHANIAANEEAIRETMQFTRDDVMVAWLPLYHDMGMIGGLLAPLYCGFPVVLMAPQAFLATPRRWLAAIARYRATVSGGPDFAYQLCVDRIRDRQLADLDLSSWRVAFCGAEPIRPKTMASFAERFAPAGFSRHALYPCYGLAEATLLVTGVVRMAGAAAVGFDAHALARGRAERTPDGTPLIDCGRTARRHRVRIVDPATGEPVADGAVGEIWFGGPSVTAGYWRNDAATADTFVEVADAADGPGRWLRTGDLGFRSGARVFVSGRLKDVIIVRGQNLYPQDIEGTLAERVDGFRKGRIAAFAVEHDGVEGIGVAAEIPRGRTGAEDFRDLYDAVNRAVADVYGEPVQLVLLLAPGDLPRTSSGKLRRRACLSAWRDGALTPLAVLQRDGALAALRRRTPYRPCADDRQRRIARIWEAVLGVDAIGIDDDFFELGGDSLGAARVAARLAVEFATDAEPGFVFAARTIATQASRLQAGEAAEGARLSIHARRPDGDAVREFPLTGGQQALWFLWQLDRDSHAYNVTGRARLTGPVDVDRLQRAVAAVVGQHEVLRTRFVEIDGEPCQRVTDQVAYGWRTGDVRASDANGRAASVDAFLADDAATPFDLEAGPLLRVGLVRETADAWTLGIATHHIVSDAASFGLVLSAMVAWYEHLGGLRAAPAQPAVQFGDYARWERAASNVERADKQLDYWRQQLGVDHTPLELPFDRARQPQRGGSAGQVATRLAPASHDRLARFAREHGTTLPAVLLAAYAIVLYRYSGQPAVRIGVPVSLRRHVETEQLIGYLINTVVVSAQLNGGARFADVVRDVHARLADAQTHCDVPFHQVVAALQPERIAGVTPLFQAMFNMERPDDATPERCADLALSDVSGQSEANRFDLVLNAIESRDGLRFAFNFPADLFDPATVERIAAHFVETLDQLTATPARAIGSCGLTIDYAERERVPAAHPFDPVPLRIARRAALQPAAPALQCEDDALTYGQLDAWSSDIARRLAAAGAAADVRVGLCVERSPGLVAGLLGILRAGAAFVPLDPDYPAARLRDMLDDAGVACVLSDERSAARLATLFDGRSRVDIGTLPPAGQPAVGFATPAIHPDQLAYVIYTSGSTGKPKGVAISHRALSLHLDDFLATYALDASDRQLHSSTVNFDVALHEIFPALIQGGQVLMRGAQMWDLETMSRRLVDGRVTFARIPTAYWRQWLRNPPAADALAALRQITVGGEALPGDALAQWRGGALAHIRLDNLYGPTETTIACLYRQTVDDDALHAAAPIGRPYPSRTAFVLDANGNEMPVGGPGELYVGGDTLARGYLNRPALSAERFVPDPFAQDGSRLYRTGDLVRRRLDGTVEFLGRVDDQIKLRGFRIEPGEIEAALRRLNGVADAAVEVRGAGEKRRLVGYVVGGETAPGVDEIRRSLEAQLPGYMVPTAYVMLDAMPVMPNGKIDRRALPEPVHTVGETRVEARNDVERTLLSIWHGVLGRTDHGVTENFFELGGDSILSLQIVARARQAGLKLSARQVFEHPTVEGLARVARAAHGETRRAEIRTPLPLTPIQQMFFERFPHGESHWNQTVLLSVTGALDVAALEQVLAAQIDAHDALRLRFSRDEEGRWHQQVTERETQPVLALFDLRGRLDWKAELEAQCARLQGGLDIERGPLIRAGYFTLEGEARLLLTVHHLAVDGVSWRVLLEELRQGIERAARGEPMNWFASTPWSAWVESQAQYAQRDAVKQEAKWWRESLHEASIAWPEAREKTTGKTEPVVLKLDPIRTRELLQDVPGTSRMSVEEVLLASLARTLGESYGPNGVLISLEGHGREIPDDALATELDLSRTVGWFTTRYPVWLKRSDDTGAILRETKSRIRAAPHRGLHFGLLREELKDLPQPQVSFNYLGQFDQSIGGDNRFAFAGELHGESMAQTGESPYVLDLNALVAGGELTLAWDYDAARVDAEQVEHLVSRFDENLSALVAHCMNAGPLITAADFPLSGLTDAQLDALALPLPAVDDLYPATPLQQGLLFHTLLDKRPGLYVNQKRLTFEGRLDARAMRDAWQAALNRHAVLRTRFEWRHDGPALQVVDARLALPFDPHDWSALTADVYETRLANWLRDDARRGFDLSRAPLVRVALFARPDGGHDLVWTNHHILTDGWSAAQLLGEISRDYALRCAGSRLDVAPVPYRNYVAWRARQDDSLDWWSARRAEADDPAQLADAIGASEPNEAHEPREPHEQPLLSDRELPAASVHALTSAARRAHVTLNTLLQGAWAILLARYSGRRQVAFGVTVSGRPPELPGIETMIGLFINSLPVWVDVRNDAPLDAWLGRLQQYNAELRLREHTPLDALKRHLGGAGAEPFDSLLIFENYPVETGLRRFGDRLTLGAWQSFERTHYPLSLTITADGESIRLAWIADPAHVDAATLERIANAYVRIASALAGGDTARVGDVGVPSEPSRPVPLESHHGLPLLARFAAEARRRPAARAVSCDGRHLTYDGLDRLSNRIANVLLRAGVPREARVALCTARSADMVGGLLGVLKAGAAYVPLDPAYPAARLSDMLDDSRVEWIVTDARNAASGHPCFEGRRIVVIEAVRDAADGADEAPDVAIESAQLAYVIYTSGSTGRPKGVGISHDALGRFLAGVGARIGLRPGDRMLAATTLSFDIAGLELYLPLVCGAQVEIAPRDVVQDGHRFARWVERADGTVLQATPSGWRNLLEGGWAGQRGMTALCGGEALPRDLADALLARGVTLWNLYGPTETTIWSTVGLIRAGEPVTLGEPLHDTVLRVLGADGAEAPPGGMGELCIGGAMLARGYVGRPALTAERFVPDPHGDGARLYRTGDLVRRHADGSLAYLGRADQQVKLHGYRIEPGEVEAVLRRMPGVRDAVVVVRGHAIDARLTGYVAVGPDAGDAAMTADTLRAFASARLPAHMVPGAWGLLDALPLTPNGKVDRRRLPDPDAAAATWEAPRGEAETTLAALWSQVLGVERVGRRDDFFALGGHSLLAVRMTSRVRQALARDVTLQTVFRHPSLAAFADAVRALAPIDGEAAGSTTTREAPRDDRGYPLSHAQERLWFLWKLAPQSAAYHMAGALRLTGPLDRAALKHALDTLVERHASLRTRFASDDGVATQAIVAAAAYGWSEHDLGGIGLGIGEAARDARLQTLLEAAASEPFDLERGPVFRASLVELTPDAHVLQFAMHHIVSDGWSQTILLREFGELYAAAVEARPPQLPPLPRQYAEYARDERERADDARIASDLDWWREQLGATHPVLVLPSTRKAADERHERSDRGGRQLAELTPAQWDRVKALANRHHATPFMVLLAAYALLLQRLGGQDDVRIGFPVAGRDRADVERVVGFFVNTLVARVRVSPRQPFAALLAGVRDTVIDAQSHGNVPFATLIDALQPTRSLGQTPLFQAMFNFEPGLDASALRLPGLTVEPVETDRAFAQFDLSLHVREHADGARLSMVYASDRFDAATVERWLGYYVRVLETAVDDAPRATGNVALLSGDEHASHVALGRCDADYGTPEPVHRLIAKQARTRPHAQAVVYRDSVLTYAELDAAANRVAHRLAALGVGPDVCVGIAAERSTEMVVGLLGILKAGGAYVPLDPDYPRERLSYMLDDSGVRLLLTQSRLRSRLPVPAGVDVLELDAADLSGEPPTDPGVTVHGDNLAYVIYTSGSTGKPKGAANRHDALYNRLAWMQSAYRLDDTDTVLQKTPFSFDVSVWEFFWPLMVGARLAMAEPGAHREPRRLVELIGRHRVTTLHFVPSMLQAFVEHEGAGACDGLKRVICSGEALPAELANRAQRTLPRAALYNLYGPTEAAIDVTHWTCRAGDDSVPIGRPIGNVTTYVLDGAMNVVPPGAAGELYLGGAGLARGYLHRAVLTAERFVPDPFDTEGGRLYRTGDLARWNGEGALEYLGRIDHQVKVRGFRIEPGEIEAQLLAQAGVRDAVVTAHAGPGGTRLVAYVTAQAGGTLAAQPLRERLAVVLPDYMVPGAIVVLDALPLNPNGKVDRRALPAPDAVAREYEAPAGDVETALARIWQQVLGVEQVGRHDNFFELGGDSILSLKVVERAARAGFALAPRDLFEQQTVAALAARVSVVSVAGQPGVEARIEPVPADRRATLPLSHAQQRQWFLWNLQPDSSAYHIAGGLRVRGPLDADAARAAFDAICARHDVLRTTFGQTENGLPAQTVHASMPVDWRVARVDAADAQTVAQAFAAGPFDLASGPLMRVALLELADDEHLLVLVMHHIVSDAWSIELIVDEFVAHYAAVQESRAVNAEPLPLQYGDYAAWQRARLDGGEAARQLAYWRGLLGGEHPVLALPADGPRRPLAERRAARHEIALPAALTDAVRAQARARNTTPFVVFLAALHALLHRYTGQRRVRTGVPVANRHHPDTQRLIGFFVNTQVLQADIEPATTLAQLMRELGERAADAQTHQDLPFDVLVDALGVERSLTHTPLFQVMYNHVRREWRSLRAIRGLDVEPYVVAGGTAQFELMLETREEADGALVASLRYARDLFHEETIARMGRHYRALLEAVVCDPATAIGEVGLLDDGERGTLLEWGSACSVDEATLPLHGQIARQAARRADAVAVVCEGHALGYGELNARANRLAHRLIALGVGPEVRVGLAMERSLELVVGLLAILKAGGAYVPLDPSYPQDRLAYMIRDSGIALLLAQSSVVERLPSSSNVQTLLVDALDVADEPATDPVVAVHESNLAYVIYTSGSTGRPKGAQLTHRNVARLLTSTQHGFDFNENDVWTLFHSYAFDFSVWEIFGALCHGGRLVVVPYLVSRSPEEFVELLHREQVTVLNQTPSAFRQLMAVPGLYDGKNLSLRLVIFGGEALEPQTLRPWFDHFGDAKPRLVNMYGITETTVHVTYRPITQADLNGQRSPVGERIQDLGVYVLDAQMNLSPVGVEGELYVSGEGLARGYLNRAGLTAERFVPNPFAEDGSRLYRTGDLARWNAQGELEYAGRLDHQVKVRGFRIELGEIEAQLLKQSGVSEAVVLTQESASGTRLIGYVTAHNDALLDGQSLRSQLAQTLPDYMVPSVVMVLDSLPLTPNGKLDRRALPEPEHAVAEAHIEARNDVERTLLSIWHGVLGRTDHGVTENFFELGGDSILSLQIVARARQAGLKLGARQVFEHPTVEGLARVARAAHGETRRAEIRTPLPLTPIQQMFFERFPHGESHWNQTVLLSVTGALDVAALEQVLAAQVDAHDALRLRFSRDEEGRWHQQVTERETQPVLALFDLRGHADWKAELEAQCARLQGGLDIERGPLIRAGYFTLENEARLLLTVHHLAVDGVSWRVLLEELRQGIERAARGEPVNWLASTPWSAWVESQAQYAQRDAVKQEAKWWRESLQAASVAWTEAHEKMTGKTEPVLLKLDPIRTRELLQDVPGTSRMSVEEVLLASLARTLGESYGPNGVLISLEGHGREIPDDALATELDLSRTVGWFTTRYPVWLKRSDDTGAILRETKSRIRAVPHRGLHFGLLREELKDLPQPQVSFNYLGQFDQSIGGDNRFAFAGEPHGESMAHTGESPYVLDLNALVAGGELTLAWDYDATRLDAEQVEHLVVRFDKNLSALVAHCLNAAPTVTATDFDIDISQQELDQFLEQLSD